MVGCAPTLWQLGSVIFQPDVHSYLYPSSTVQYSTVLGSLKAGTHPNESRKKQANRSASAMGINDETSLHAAGSEILNPDLGGGVRL